MEEDHEELKEKYNFFSSCHRFFPTPSLKR